MDCRLMFYRKAGISVYTRQLVCALAQQAALAQQTASVVPTPLAVLMDRRDDDTAWLPSNVRICRAFTPAHHKLEHLTLPIELALLNLRAPIALVHFPDFIACAGVFKKVITVHDLYFVEHPSVMNADGARYYGRIHASAQRAHAIIAVSEFTKSDVLRLLPHVAPQKAHVVLEAAEELRIENEELRMGNDLHSPFSILNSEFQPYALFVGTFEPRKNLRTLLQALAHTPHDFRLVVVGETGWGDNEPTQLAQALGVQSKVHFAGRVSNAERDQLYAQARLFVFPSLSEGFGLPVLEAMAHGTPVVCNNAGALPEVAGNAAVLVNALDPQALAHALTQVWTNPQTQADLRERGLQRAAQFSWARAAQETWAVYERVLGKV